MSANQRFTLLLATILMTGLCVISANVVVVAQSKPPKVIRAQSFEVVDESGKPRVSLYVDKNNKAIVQVGREATSRVRLQHDPKTGEANIAGVGRDPKTGKVYIVGLSTIGGAARESWQVARSSRSSKIILVPHCFLVRTRKAPSSC